MRTQRYPSDVTDEQWALLESPIPVYPGGRPRKTDLRDVADALLYVLHTGCQLRYPPKSTAWRYFDEWRHNGTLEEIYAILRDRVRKQEKPGHPRRTASIDSQSVETSSGGEAVGRDNAKNVTGRKRHIVLDSLGLLLAVVVTAADVDDGAAAQQVLPVGGAALVEAAAGVRGQQVPQPRPVRLGGRTQLVRTGDRAPPQGGRRLGAGADPLDGRADVRLVDEMPAAERRPGEEYPVGGGHDSLDDDSSDTRTR